MDTEFRFEVRWNDEDVFDVRVTAWNGTFGGSANVYVAIGGLREAAAKLEGFPHQPSDKRELEFGAFGPKFAGGAASMHFSCKDAAGHAFLEARIESEYDTTEKAQSVTLFGTVEAAAIDTFVSELRRLEVERHGVAHLRISGTT
jgi:hypothetical protein